MKYDVQFTNGGALDAKYRDHDLTGNYKGTRECHIEPDWLRIHLTGHSGRSPLH